MIVREIKENPEKELQFFDYFNDYKDTRKWCLSNCPELVKQLDAGYTKYVEYIRG